MKRLLLTAFLLASFSAALAQTPERELGTRITNVTVYQTGAVVTRQGSVSLPAGTSVVRLTGLAREIDPASIQVQVRDGATIMAVTPRTDYVDTAPVDPRVVELRSRRNVLQDSLQTQQALLSAYQQEEKMLTSNQAVGGQNGLQVENFRSAVEFFRTRFIEVKRRQMDTQKRMQQISREISSVDRQIREITASPEGQATGEIAVTLHADRAGQVDLALNYLVEDAGWEAAYDVRVDDPSKPIRMDYRGTVYQETGETWTDVKLVLSSGIPTEMGVKPELSPLTVSFERPPTMRFTAPVAVMDSEEPPPQEELSADTISTPGLKKQLTGEIVTVEAVEIVSNVVSHDFEIALPSTIPSDGKPNIVRIQSYELPAEYVHYAAPVKDRFAYLTGRITGWEDLNLMPGEANLYLGGSYVGRTKIDPQQTEDTLSVALGRDRSVVVERKLVKERSSRQMLGSRASRTQSFRIDVRNARPGPIRLTLEDQVPVSTDRDIEVDEEIENGGVMDKETGVVRWNFQIPSARTQAAAFQYTLKYPKGRAVVIR